MTPVQRTQLSGVLASVAVGAGLAAVGNVAFIGARQLVFVGRVFPPLPSFATEVPTPIWLAALGGAAISALAIGRPWGNAWIVRAGAAALCVIAAATAVLALALPSWRALPTGRWVDVAGGVAVAVGAAWLAIRRGERVLMSARHGLIAMGLTALALAPSILRSARDHRGQPLAEVELALVSVRPLRADERPGASAVYETAEGAWVAEGSAPLRGIQDDLMTAELDTGGATDVLHLRFAGATAATLARRSVERQGRREALVVDGKAAVVTPIEAYVLDGALDVWAASQTDDSVATLHRQLTRAR